MDKTKYDELDAVLTLSEVSRVFEASKSTVHYAVLQGSVAYRKVGKVCLIPVASAARLWRRREVAERM